MDLDKIQDNFRDRIFPNGDSKWYLNAMVGEVGEVANVLKKLDFYQYFKDYKEMVDRKVSKGERQTFREMLVDELGDVLYYFVNFCSVCEISLEEVYEGQVEKLKRSDKRYGRLYKK